MKAFRSAARQRGGFFIGLVVGLLIGLAGALGVALYVTKAPIPFINKVPSRSQAQDAAETERNRNWDPNSALAGRNPAGSASAAGTDASAAVATSRPTLTPPTVIDPLPAPPADTTKPARTAASASTATTASTRASQPAPTAAALASSPFMYFVQAGAYSRTEDAEQQRAKPAMLGA